MIQLRMARLAPPQPDSSLLAPRPAETPLAFTYLRTFRRIVVSLAVVGAAIAFAVGWTGFAAACACIGVGEWIESSYYLNVLRWRQAGPPPAHSGGLAPAQARMC